MLESTPPSESTPPKTNGLVGLLTALAHSTNKWVQLGTLALIALTGLGNWAATWKSADRNKAEIEVSRRVASEGEQRIKQEVIRQVAEIHRWMREATEEFHKGNEDSAANRKMLNTLMREDLEGFERRQLAALDNQNKMMDNQTKMLANDSVLIKEIHDVVEKFDRWKSEQQIKREPGGHP